MPLFPYGHIYLDSLTDGPLFIEIDDRSRLPSAEHIDQVLLEDNNGVQAIESTMSKRFV